MQLEGSHHSAMPTHGMDRLADLRIRVIRFEQPTNQTRRFSLRDAIAHAISVPSGLVE